MICHSMTTDQADYRVGIRIPGELKEWISREARNRGFYNDSEFVRSLLYQEMTKSKILETIDDRIAGYIRGPEGQAVIRDALRSEFRGEPLRTLIRAGVEDVLQDYVVEKE